MEIHYIKTSVSSILLPNPENGKLLHQNISVTYITPCQKHENNNYMSFESETFGSHNSVYDHNHHLGCDTVKAGEYAMKLQRNCYLHYHNPVYGVL
jgi:hypothetical protein